MTATLTTSTSPTTPGTAQQNPPQPAPAATCTLVEFCDWRGANPRFDRELGLLSGVKILGVRSQNGRVYRPEALAAAVGLYEGAKVNVNHPKGHPRSPRDYQERIGSIRNVALRPGEGLFGDFHFNPRHALAEQLLWDAAHAPENVGFSHNVEARLARHDDQVMVEAITRVHSVDLVADPATTAGLFEAATVDGSSLIGNLLRSEQPTLADTLLTESRNEIARLTEANMRLQSELAQLRTEAERTTATLAAAERSALIGALLAEFKLPPAGSIDAANRAITSSDFVQELLAAPSNGDVRRLVEERAALVAGIRHNLSGTTNNALRPVSRAPRGGEPAQPSLNVGAFVRAIRG